MVGCEGPLSPSLSALGRAVSLCNASFLLPGDPASRRRRRDEPEGAERSGCARKEMHLACWRSVGLGRVHVLVRGKSEINYCLPSVGLRGSQKRFWWGLLCCRSIYSFSRGPLCMRAFKRGQRPEAIRTLQVCWFSAHANVSPREAYSEPRRM